MSIESWSRWQPNNLGKALIGLCLCVVLSACTPSPKNPTENKTYNGSYPIKATVTVGMVADLVRHIGGEQVQVTQLMSEGVDPHLYKPSPDDLRAILGSDIVFNNGLMLEGKMSEALKASSRSRPTCSVGDLVERPKDLPDDDPHHPDPHVWMDVSLWSQAAGIVGEFLAKYDPKHADQYTQRTRELREKLNQLHQHGQEIMAKVPKERRVLITSHDAFRYFGHAYGLEVQAIQGISTDSEAGLQRINELVDLLVNRQIEAVFVESSVPPKSIEALLEGAKARGRTVKIGGELFSDAMGKAGTPEGTYPGMMKHNLETIAKALGAE